MVLNGEVPIKIVLGSDCLKWGITMKSSFRGISGSLTKHRCVLK